VKLVVSEDGSELASELWQEREPAAASVLSYAEGRAALAAARRGGRLTLAQHRRALADFEVVQDELVLIGVDEALARTAGQLAEELSLRGYDAVHLATGLALGEDTLFATWDNDLRRAALGSGCAVAPASFAVG
jgi:predicted nucleic acid-binding protein